MVKIEAASGGECGDQLHVGGRADSRRAAHLELQDAGHKTNTIIHTNNNNNKTA